MDQDEFKAWVCATDAEKFVREELFDENCWLFQQAELVAPSGAYKGFKTTVANLVGINPNQVALVGSAKYGFSMSPSKKAWRPFDPNPDRSDLDCAIVSPELFNETVDAVRRAYFEGYGHLHALHAGQVFAGHIVLSSATNYKSAYLREIAKRLVELRKVTSKFLRFEPDVKYRIYQSYPVAEAYHIEGVKKLQSMEI